MTEPRTEAGRRLVAKADALNARSFAIVTVEDALAIEAQAVADERARLRREVERLGFYGDTDWSDDMFEAANWAQGKFRAGVLALLGPEP